MYVTPYGKLISDESNIKSNNIQDKVSVEVHSDANNNNYLLFEDKNNILNTESVLFWKKYILDNVDKIKQYSSVKYYVIKFVNNSSIIIWS